MDCSSATALGGEIIKEKNRGGGGWGEPNKKYVPLLAGVLPVCEGHLPGSAEFYLSPTVLFSTPYP